MPKANFLPQTKVCLLENSPNAKAEILYMVKHCYKKMADRKILHNISWTMLLSGYQIQSAQKIWPGIKKAMLWFSPTLNRLFPGWSKARLPLACDNPKKVKALLGNYATGLSLIKEYGSLSGWLAISDNILEDLVKNFSYIGNNNVRPLLDSLGFKNFHTHHQGLAKVFTRWRLLDPKYSTDAVFKAINLLSRAEGYDPLEGYAILYLFSQTICGETPLCSQCTIGNCPEKNKGA
ncbi:MAG: hypothetical protein M1609_16250 [Firmicutes bacterium]|nr:hypothetical protein [Bacillota bacterium]MCL5056796.1 hypothetical protein [Actinomycetota bacterium]